MRFFFRSRQFKIILAVIAAVLALSLISGVIGGVIAPHSGVLGTITAPFVTLFQRISDGINDIGDAYRDGNELMIKNAELETEINELREELADYNKGGNLIWLKLPNHIMASEFEIL